jgi:hypothetical protein
VDHGFAPGGLRRSGITGPAFDEVIRKPYDVLIIVLSQSFHFSARGDEHRLNFQARSERRKRNISPCRARTF